MSPQRRTAGSPPRQAPYKRTYGDGRVVWIARYRDLQGARRYAKPRWNDRRSTFLRKGDAQRAIDEALADQRGTGFNEPKTLGAYFGTWLEHHPRAARTNDTYRNRIGWVLDVEIDGVALRDWFFDELRRRHVHQLLDHMLRVEGRSAQGARGIVAVLSAMAEDAIGDDIAQGNPFMGLRLRRSDPRVKKPPRLIRVWSFEQMREFAAAGQAEIRSRTPRPPDSRSRNRYCTKERFYSPHDYEALLLTPALTGLRLGEFLALRRADYADGMLTIEYSAHNGQLVGSSDQKNHSRGVPVPPTLARLYEKLSPRSDSDLLFTTPRGLLWRERNFYRDVWTPAQLASGLDPTPHEFRHSYVTHLRAAGIDDADLAKVAGHRVETMISVYTHALDRSHDAIREVIG